jgi:hypothetical protein
MIDLRNSSDKQKRDWLINQMKEHWYLDEDDITDGNCNDSASVEGNSGISFGDIYKLCQQLDWFGFEFGGAEIFIDLKVLRQKTVGLKSYLPSADGININEGVLRLWFD